MSRSPGISVTPSLRFVARVAFICFIFSGLPSIVRANDAPVIPGQPSRSLASAPAKRSTKAQPTADARAWQQGLAGSLLSSRFAWEHKDIAESARFLQASLERDPENEALQHQAMRAHVMAGDIKQAIMLAKQLLVASPSDPLVATLLMMDALERKSFDEALHLASKPADRGLFGIIRPVLQQWIGVLRGGLKAPVDMRQAIASSGFFAPFLQYHAALLNDVLGFHDLARSYYEQSAEDLAVTPFRVVEAAANFYARQHDRAAHDALLGAYAKHNPDTQLPLHNVEASQQPPKALVANASEGIAELFFATASILFGEELTNESFIYLRLALAFRSEFPPAQLMLATLYEQQGELKEAARLYKAIPRSSPLYLRAQVRQALNLEALGQQHAAINKLQALAEQFAHEASPLITLGDVYRTQGMNEEAITAYGEAMSRVGTLQSHDWPLLYARGVAYERAGMWNAAERDFKRALQLEPNQPDVLNYLGYSWLLMGKHTARAKEYIATALTSRPDDAHILDSMGWAHYMLGEYEAAVGFIEKAADSMPQDVTINEHLGDAYWRVGRKTEAEFQWRRALSFKPEEVDRDRLKQKLASGLPDRAATSAATATPKALAEGVKNKDVDLP